MADTKNTDTPMSHNKTSDQLQSQRNEGGSNQTMRHEHAKREVADRSQEKGAIGGSEGSQTGETGRARNELDEKSRSEFEKNSTETAGSR